MMPVTVTLETWEAGWARVVGRGRDQANSGRPDAAHYKAPRMEDNETASIRAAAAECAVAKYLNVYWSGSVWPVLDHHRFRRIADAGRSIEVRTVRTRPAAAVRVGDLGRDLSLWVARVPNVETDRIAVEILGWMPADQAWSIGTPSDYSPGTTRLVALDDLRSPLIYEGVPA